MIDLRQACRSPPHPLRAPLFCVHISFSCVNSKCTFLSHVTKAHKILSTPVSAMAFQHISSLAAYYRKPHSQRPPAPAGSQHLRRETGWIIQPSGLKIDPRWAASWFGFASWNRLSLMTATILYDFNYLRTSTSSFVFSFRLFRYIIKKINWLFRAMLNWNVSVSLVFGLLFALLTAALGLAQTEPDDPCYPAWFEHVVCFNGSWNIWPFAQRKIKW